MTAVGVGELTSMKLAASGDCSSSAAVWLPAAGCGSGSQQSASLGTGMKAAPVEIASTKHVTALTTAASWRTPALERLVVSPDAAHIARPLAGRQLGVGGAPIYNFRHR